MQDQVNNTYSSNNKKRLYFVLFCIFLGGILLSSSNIFFPKLTSIVGILVGGIIVGFVYYVPGKVTLFRDILLLVTWILTGLIAITIVELYCYWDSSNIICIPASIRAIKFGDIALPGVIVVLLWISFRVHHLLHILRKR